MSDTTSRLELPYISSGQAQKHITHNEALRMLDALIHISVESQQINIPVSNPQQDQAWIIGPDPTGEWGGHSQKIAIWTDTAWQIHTPKSAFIVYVKADEEFVFFHEGAWELLKKINEPPTAPESMPQLGINTSASSYDKLSVKTDSILFSHDDVSPGSGDMRIKLNKLASDNASTFQFQTNWSGRTELGLAGEDAFSIRCSGDGANWNYAMRIDPYPCNVAIGSHWPQAKLDVDGMIKLKSYTQSTLPSANGLPAGTITYVVDGPNNGQILVSNGENWV